MILTPFAVNIMQAGRGRVAGRLGQFITSVSEELLKCDFKGHFLGVFGDTRASTSSMWLPSPQKGDSKAGAKGSH